MATTRRINKRCIDCNHFMEGKADSDQWKETGVHDACNDCYDYWMHENEHSDGGHDQILEWLGALTGPNATDLPTPAWMQDELRVSMPGCRVCRGPAIGGPAEGPEVDTEGSDTKGWHSHKGHGHALTQAARARCRREQRKLGQA